MGGWANKGKEGKSVHMRGAGGREVHTHTLFLACFLACLLSCFLAFALLASSSSFSFLPVFLSLLARAFFSFILVLSLLLLPLLLFPFLPYSPTYNNSTPLVLFLPTLPSKNKHNPAPPTHALSLVLRLHTPQLRASESFVHALIREQLHAERKAVGVLVALLVDELDVAVVCLLGGWVGD